MQVGNLHMGILYTSGVKTKQVLFCISWVIIPFFSHLETFRATSQHAFINSINMYLNIKRQRSSQMVVIMEPNTDFQNDNKFFFFFTKSDLVLI